MEWMRGVFTKGQARLPDLTSPRCPESSLGGEAEGDKSSQVHFPGGSLGAQEVCWFHMKEELADHGSQRNSLGIVHYTVMLGWSKVHTRSV